MLIIELDDTRTQLVVRSASESRAALAEDSPASYAWLGRLGAAWIASINCSTGQVLLNGRRLQGNAELHDRDVLELRDVSVAFDESEVALEPVVGRGANADCPAVSPAELRVLEALARPWTAEHSMAVPASNAEIAAELVLSVHTVKSHLRRLFGKFDLDGLPRSRKRVALIETALRAGLVNRP